MSKCVKHIWRNHPDNSKKVVCKECGAEQYKAKLSKTQLAELAPKLEVTPFDLLMWVGSSYYKLEEFIDEARRIGCSKRIPKLPIGVVNKVTRVFLLYEDVGIFGYFTVRGITYVVKPGVNIPEELEKRGVKEWEYKDGDFGFADERGCGSLMTGGMYLLSEEDMEKVKDLAESSTLGGHIVILEEPIPYEGKKFRSFKYVEGDKILAKAPQHEWWVDKRTYDDNWNAYYRWKAKLEKLKEQEEDVA